MTAFPPSAKLPASSRLDLEKWKNEESAMSTNASNGKRFYGGRLLVRVSSVPHPDNFNRQLPETGSISNPASYYLRGAHLEKIRAPACHLTSCHGPYPNDGSLLINKDNGAPDEECQQVFITMNGCVADKGYPIGMVCTVCCKCTKEFVYEMSRSRGFLEGIN
ncbi:unnamed protein product [Gongylonema pulchrum]|uniref:Peptidase M12A domain-containing protein n=1 Tax=Gongylonema pulchrum TaxID=637853 RepID=A0A183D5A5_9BILA|nr:unnamed protein product [Gongylonema pulchrum]